MANSTSLALHSRLQGSNKIEIVPYQGAQIKKGSSSEKVEKLIIPPPYHPMPLPRSRSWPPRPRPNNFHDLLFERKERSVGFPALLSFSVSSELPFRYFELNLTSPDVTIYHMLNKGRRQNWCMNAHSASAAENEILINRAGDCV
jgi:hypothetical protein